MKNIHNWINTGLIVIVGILVLVGGNNQPGPLGGVTNFDQLDVTDGYLVDGTTVIDGNGLYASKLTTNAGHLRSYTNATSSTAATQTLVQADILDYDSVLFTSNTGNITLTFPATSTLTSFVPTAGDLVEQCWFNATSTAAISITFAAGAGMDIQTASSTPSALTLRTGRIGCFKHLRQTDTDIVTTYTEFRDAD